MLFASEDAGVTITRVPPLAIETDAVTSESSEDLSNLTVDVVIDEVLNASEKSIYGAVVIATPVTPFVGYIELTVGPDSSDPDVVNETCAEATITLLEVSAHRT